MSRQSDDTFNDISKSETYDDKLNKETIIHKEFYAPILVLNSSNLEKIKQEDKIAFDIQIEKMSGAKIKFTKFDKNSNLLIFPLTENDHQIIKHCKDELFLYRIVVLNKENNQKSKEQHIIIKGLSFNLATKYQDLLH